MLNIRTFEVNDGVSQGNRDFWHLCPLQPSLPKLVDFEAILGPQPAETLQSCLNCNCSSETPVHEHFQHSHDTYPESALSRERRYGMCEVDLMQTWIDVHPNRECFCAGKGHNLQHCKAGH